ncbi:murein hydrolase activator EnvC family protein [Janibacter sp. GS2]|uniref:murein hydrolase activator EnvC family protein n=1 Tax=Janibacter sp. GS2 TaxID=3442646 RepID=UPI003EBA7E65
MAAAQLIALALVAHLLGSPPPSTGARWEWPVGEGQRPRLEAPFDAPHERWGPGHRGIDLRTAKGAEVTAVADGVVTHRGRIAGRGTVSITHAHGVRSTYEPVDSDLSAGDRVRRGEVIGDIGAGSGHCTPRVCLHLGAKRGPDYLDPLPFFGARRVILLPFS